MSTIIKDGGPAFPYGQKNFTERSSEGMSLRDYFAGQALAGMMANKNAQDWTLSEVATDCYLYADALLKHRMARR
jgi:hypothetical protein